MNYERRKTMKAWYTLPFTGKRKVDRIKTALEVAALIFMVSGIVAACSIPLSNDSIQHGSTPSTSAPELPGSGT
jgi:hypothetical protein